MYKKIAEKKITNAIEKSLFMAFTYNAQVFIVKIQCVNEKTQLQKGENFLLYEYTLTANPVCVGNTEQLCVF